MTSFAVGDKVAWTSSSTRKIGVVTHIIPARQTPSDFKLKAGGGGRPRDHETYVIRAKPTYAAAYGKPERQGSAANYWPFVTLLEKLPT